MKKLFSIVPALMLLWASVVTAQTRNVTINVEGNRFKQIAVDNKYYTISTTTASGEQTFEITDLQTGQHQLHLYRYTNSRPVTTTFNLREGFDMNITVNSNGSVNLSETRTTWKKKDNNGAAMTASSYNKLYKATKAKPSSSARTSYLLSQFNVLNTFFTSSQATKLIQLVNSESSRLKLAKAVYPMITDVANFSMVSNLLKSSSNRAELNDYIASLPTNTSVGTNAAYAPLTSERFNIIYNEVVAENSTDRTYYLMNFFNKNFNYYTSAQLRQLLQLIGSETDRLELAKNAYRGITDRESFYNEMYPLFSSTANRTELKAYADNYDNNATTPTTTTGTAMSATAFNSLYNNIYYQSASAKYNSVYTAFTTTGNYFTSAQARQLINLVTDENSRLALAKASIATLVDRSNYTVLNDLFSYQTSRNELAAYVNSYNSGNTTPTTTTGVAMSATAFNSLYQNIYYQNTSSRYNSVNTAFTTAGNYFTSAQARQLIGLVSDENSRLALAKASIATLVDRTNYTILNDLFSYQSSRNELAAYVNSYNNGTTPTGGYGAMSDAEFNTLYRNVNSAWSASSKYSQVSMAFQNTTNRFTIAQVRQLLLLISTESERLALAKLSYDNVVDQYNYAALNDVFNSYDYRTEWARYVTDIQNGGTGAVNRVAMSESEFNTISRSVQFTFGFGAKQAALVDIFNKETNYFTVAQIEELIRMVSNESNRLELAKLAYNNAVDPANYTSLMDLFTSQTTKDELSAYISANANIR